MASALTTFKLTAVTSANESTLAGVSGVFTHEVGIEVDHAFRTWLDATLKFTGDRDSYVGSARQDDRYAGSFALTYKLTRELQLKGELRREWLELPTPPATTTRPMWRCWACGCSGDRVPEARRSGCVPLASERRTSAFRKLGHPSE